MIPKDLITTLASQLKIENHGQIEKDLYLQGMLLELEKSSYFTENFVFKGGTCLTKAYFGYYRFSEDLDFTWIKQDQFNNKSENQVRRILSKEINTLMELLHAAAQRLELDFKPHKHDKHYVQLGGSNRFATFKFWYTPTEGGTPTFIKTQINFLEKMTHKPEKREIHAIAPQLKEQIEAEYPQHYELATKKATLYSYDLKEIAAEKARAILTRRGFKARDIIDLYMFAKKGITTQTEKKEIIKKTIFMFKYLKYSQNLANKKLEEKFSIGKEETLLIKKPGEDFEQFAEKTLKQLNELAEEIRNTK